MDAVDIFETIVEKIDEQSSIVLNKLAHRYLPDDWSLTNNGYREDLVEWIADAISAEYFDSGAAEEWGPSLFVEYSINTAV